MGLPEERGRNGSGSGGREEAGAGGRTRSWSPPPEVSRSAHVPSLQRYRELHRRSLEEPRGEAGPGRAWGAPVRRGAGAPWRGLGLCEEVEVHGQKNCCFVRRWKGDSGRRWESMRMGGSVS